MFWETVIQGEKSLFGIKRQGVLVFEMNNDFPQERLQLSVKRKKKKKEKIKKEGFLDT